MVRVKLVREKDDIGQRLAGRRKEKDWSATSWYEKRRRLVRGCGIEKKDEIGKRPAERRKKMKRKATIVRN